MIRKGTGGRAMGNVSSGLKTFSHLRSPSGGLTHSTGVGGRAPSLDTNSQNRTKAAQSSSDQPKRREWSRQQKRIYHRVMSLLQFWMSHNYGILWICLTSSPKSDPSKLAYHFKILRQRIERKLGFKGLQYVSIRTNEGNGVLHVLLSWRPPRGVRPYRFYIPQRWLSEQWEAIHGAKVVWVARVRYGEKSRRNLSRYIVSQYCANQNALVRISWSWRRSLGGPLVRTWKKLVEVCRNSGKTIKDAIVMWDKLLAGSVVRVEDFFGNLWVFIPPPRLGFEMGPQLSLSWWVDGGG